MPVFSSVLRMLLGAAGIAQNMNLSILLKIAGPMGALSLLLLAVGVLAARNVEHQQQISTDLIRQEVNGMLVVEELFIVMRDIRYELNLYLRTHDSRHLENVRSLLEKANGPISIAHDAARTGEESQRIRIVESGFQDFVREFERLSGMSPEKNVDSELAALNDTFLTERILNPIQECIGYNRLVVDRTTETGLATARQLRIGFLLLGITGCIAGLLAGLGIARTVSRSIVQLDISVRSVAGKLNEVSGPVHISRLGDFERIEFGVRQLEDEISAIVERLQQRELEVLRGEQLAVVGQLAAGMAHELRNPLMPVKVLVQAALERGEGARLQGRELEIVNDEICRLEKSIQTFLDFARPPAIEATSMNIGELILRAAELVQPQASRQNVELQLNLPDHPIITRVDAPQLRQVLLNLMLNSLDAMSETGWIQISLTEIPNLSTDEMTLHDAVRRTKTSGSESIQITVTDNGQGFPEELIPRAFEPFLSTKETGTGLGLSICRRIVTAHGGTIQVSRPREGGTQFAIRLPLTA